MVRENGRSVYLAGRREVLDLGAVLRDVGDERLEGRKSERSKFGNGKDSA